MIVGDLIMYLAALSWSFGKMSAETKRDKEARFLMPCQEDLAFTEVFYDRDHAEISRRLGRPYRHQFPEYLARPYEVECRFTELRDAEDDWLMRSMAGILEYVSRKEGWHYSGTVYSVINTTPDKVLREQRQYMSWYEEACEKFPRFAVDSIYIEDCPRKWSYFAAIQKFAKEHTEHKNE